MTSTETGTDESDLHLPDVMRGYRLDGIRADGRIGFYGAPESSGPRIGDRPCSPGERSRWTCAAFCVPHAQHIAPHPECVCGWRVTGMLEELADLPSGSGLDVSLRCNDDIAARPVVAEVTAWGPTLEGIPGDDPSSTVRATWMRLESRLWIHASVSRPVVRAARRRYPFARIERFGDLFDLAAEVDAVPKQTA